MKVEVNHFLNAPGRVERRRWVMPMTVEMPLASASEARVDIRLEGCDGGIRLEGTVTYDVTVNCYRCLQGWETEGLITLDRTVRSLPDGDGYSLPEDGWLALDGIVIDEVVLSLPTAPLCEKDCRGICSACGVHLNAEACECVDEDRQSPFSVLSKFL